MSPEQLRASKHVDSRTDVWSLGVIMFELLSGKVPFVGDSVLELGMRIMTVPAPSLVELREEIPTGLADVVQRCLEKEPDARFPTVDALASALRPFADMSATSLPFADTLAEPSVRIPTSNERRSRPSNPDHVRTGGEFAKTGNNATTRGNRGVWFAWAAGAVALTASIGVAGFLRTPSHVAPGASPSSFHVSFRVTPASATVRFDGEPPVPAPFIRDLPLDGRPHTAVIAADGYERLELAFRDAPPPPDLALKPLAPETTPSVAPPVASNSIAAVPPSFVRPLVQQLPAKPAAARPAAPPPPPPPASAVPAAVPKTTNDAPILR
jgi:serine/threonine-protein kinase